MPFNDGRFGPVTCPGPLAAAEPIGPRQLHSVSISGVVAPSQDTYRWVCVRWVRREHMNLVVGRGRLMSRYRNILIIGGAGFVGSNLAR